MQKGDKHSNTHRRRSPHSQPDLSFKIWYGTKCSSDLQRVNNKSRRGCYFRRLAQGANWQLIGTDPVLTWLSIARSHISFARLPFTQPLRFTRIVEFCRGQVTDLWSNRKEIKKTPFQPSLYICINTGNSVYRITASKVWSSAISLHHSFNNLSLHNFFLSLLLLIRRILSLSQAFFKQYTSVLF